MKRISGLTLSGMLLTGAFAFGQAPIVKFGSAAAPAGTDVTVLAQAPAALPIPEPMPPATERPGSPDPGHPKGNEPEEAKHEDKFFLQKLLESSPAGQTLAGNGWKVYGWTQGSYSTGSAPNSNLPVPFIDRARDFSLNQNWLHVEKSIDTSKKEFAARPTASTAFQPTATSTCRA
jgi:hypothetical protein